MNKRDRIDYILSLIKDQTEEFLEAEEVTGFELSPEELIVAAVEIVTNHPVTKMEYSSPVGKVDRERVSFMIDDDLDIPLSGFEEEDDTSEV